MSRLFFLPLFYLKKINKARYPGLLLLISLAYCRSKARDVIPFAKIQQMTNRMRNS